METYGTCTEKEGEREIVYVCERDSARAPDPWGCVSNVKRDGEIEREREHALKRERERKRERPAGLRGVVGEVKDFLAQFGLLFLGLRKG